MSIESLIPCVLTNRIEETRAFYLEHFGLELTWDSEHYIGFRSRDAKRPFQLAFRAPHPGEPTFAGGLSYAFEVADVDKEHARLTREGVRVLGAPKDNPWGDRSFVVLDPNGVGLYVNQPIPVAAEMAAFVRS
ncbi:MULTISPECIES: VOC family protein [Sandaracinus]|uniref:VOC family protein n=1 Tax=Sandaracinus TaxID=1055688 RepID=UPI0019D44A7C|nr:MULTISPECIES: VOC family protein [Sandaracinus]QRN75807.1 Glyoxalase/bleomycin resistance protein/dioxygenase [Sandaracinus sp.]UJR87333.1 Glyoxalase [Sandaracinus amylolyticus]